jgi:hypothetical protein
MSNITPKKMLNVAVIGVGEAAMVIHVSQRVITPLTAATNPHTLLTHVSLCCSGRYLPGSTETLLGQVFDPKDLH